MGTAALISEVLGTQVLAAGGIRVLEIRLVLVSEGFAESYQGKADVPYAVQAGLHYGTVLRQDVENGPPMTSGHLAEVRAGLDERLRRLEEIINLQQWEGLPHDIQGGHLF